MPTSCRLVPGPLRGATAGGWAALLSLTVTAAPPPGAVTPAEPSQRCEVEVARYLRQAMAGSAPVDAHAPEVCSCIDQRQAVGPEPQSPPAPRQRTEELRACAGNSIVSHNREWAEQQYLHELMGQRWDDGQISRFALCLATTHWRQMATAVLGEREARIDADLLWSECTTHVGRPGTPRLPIARWPLDAPGNPISPAAPK